MATSHDAQPVLEIPRLVREQPLSKTAVRASHATSWLKIGLVFFPRFAKLSTNRGAFQTLGAFIGRKDR
jgi:hypothetical protein